MPRASTTRWRFVPCLPRSVGFLPVSWPPRGRHRGGVQRGPVPVDAIGLGQLFEKHLVQPAPDARLVPVSQPAPARHPAPTPHLGRQVLPGDARLQHEQDPRQRRPVRHPGPSALGLRRLRREQRRDPRPQRIRQQFLRHGTLLHGSYSASLAAYATVLLGVLSAGGAGRNRTDDRGFADLCLTTWLRRRGTANLMAGNGFCNATQGDQGAASAAVGRFVGNQLSGRGRLSGVTETVGRG